MDGMNKQKIFDRIATHLLTQGRKSLKVLRDDPDPICLYRGPDGMSCAVGCLITDDNYTPELEDRRVNNSLIIEALEQSLNVHLMQSDIAFLEELQYIHDNDKADAWPSRLRSLADSLGLSSDAIDAASEK